MKPPEPSKRDEATAMFIASIVRSVMERVHQDLTDGQMEGLTNTIRNATFTALHAITNQSRSEGARSYVDLHTRLAAAGHEQPVLLNDYVVTEAMLEAHLQELRQDDDG